ncbi:hypothetical protein TNCV_3173951 [Trichonephila clavipes]|nr:hypothetical protein TNCV_3173951 [Trichonephila clavipes]
MKSAIIVAIDRTMNDEGRDQTIAQNRNAMVGLKKPTSSLISHFSRRCCIEFQPLCNTTGGSCMMKYQHSFRLRGGTTNMLHIPEVNGMRRNCCLAFTLPGPQFRRFLLLGPPEIACD